MAEKTDKQEKQEEAPEVRGELECPKCTATVFQVFNRVKYQVLEDGSIVETVVEIPLQCRFCHEEFTLEQLFERDMMKF